MKSVKLLSVIIMCSVLDTASVVHAMDLVISNEIVENPAASGDAALVGITVDNYSGAQIDNVNLRLNSGVSVVGGNVVQMGSIANEDTKQRMANIVSTAQNGLLPDSIPWLVEYDDVAGVHHQIIIGAGLGLKEVNQ